MRWTVIRVPSMRIFPPQTQGIFISKASSVVDMDISLSFGRQLLGTIVHSEA